jgi:hypothetical protein
MRHTKLRVSRNTSRAIERRTRYRRLAHRRRSLRKGPSSQISFSGWRVVAFALIPQTCSMWHTSCDSPLHQLKEPVMDFVSPTFECLSAPCQNPECDGTETRLPLAIPDDIETNRINSPTASQPLLVLCTRCWKVSRWTSRDDLEPAIYPQSEREGDSVFRVIEFLCAVEGCISPLRICVRSSGVLPVRLLIEPARQYAKEAGDRCFAGHFLSGRHGVLIPME